MVRMRRDCLCCQMGWHFTVAMAKDDCSSSFFPAHCGIIAVDIDCIRIYVLLLPLRLTSLLSPPAIYHPPTLEAPEGIDGGDLLRIHQHSQQRRERFKVPQVQAESMALFRSLLEHGIDLKVH
jgi:hypothetical protein